MDDTTTARCRRIAPLMLALALAGCGGGGGSSSPAPAPATATPQQPAAPRLVLTAVGSTDIGTVSSGYRTANPLAVQITDSTGAPVTGQRVTWETDDPTAWVVTPSMDTGPTSRTDTHWVAGTRATATITARVSNAAGESSVTFRARTQAAPAPISPPGRLTAYMDTTNGEIANALRVTATVESEGPSTYFSMLNWYSATPGVSGGYMGLQRDGSRFRSQLQFSVWDGVNVPATVVRATAPGVLCSRFGGEGAGMKCELDYPWQVGETFVFEVQEQLVGGVSHMTAFVTRQSSGVRTEVATLAQGAPARLNMTASFIEVFGAVPAEDTCARQLVRALRVDAPQYRVGTTWKPFKSGELNVPNPATACANSRHTALVGGGWRATVGGSTRGETQPVIFFNL